MPLLEGKDLNTPLVSGETNVSGLQNHVAEVNQPYYGSIPNPIGQSGSCNIQYQHHFMSQFPLQ